MYLGKVGSINPTQHNPAKPSPVQTAVQTKVLKKPHSIKGSFSTIEIEYTYTVYTQPPPLTTLSLMGGPAAGKFD